MPERSRVLVVDDSATVRELIRINLGLEGFDVYQACDGREALDLVPIVRPHLITMDVVMPVMDGVAAATSLKSDPRTRDIPIVMVTARAQTADKVRGKQAGVDAYLTKPFDPEHLIQTVRILIAARR